MSRVRSALLTPSRITSSSVDSLDSAAESTTRPPAGPASVNRRYGVLVTTPDDGRGTWHTITAVSLVAALRDARTGRFWEAARVGYERDTAEISAIECLGMAGH